MWTETSLEPVRAAGPRPEPGRRKAWFAATGSPDASAYDRSGPHPYLQQAAALEFAIVPDGTVTLVLDTAEVDLAAVDVAGQRGSRPCSDPGDRSPVVALTSHAGAYGPDAR